MGHYLVNVYFLHQMVRYKHFFFFKGGHGTSFFVWFMKRVLRQEGLGTNDRQEEVMNRKEEIGDREK